MKGCCPQTGKSRTSQGYKIIQITCHAEETSLDDYDETSCCRAIEPCDVFIKLVKSCRQPNKRLFFRLSVLSPISDASYAYIKGPISTFQHLLFQYRKLLWATADESSQFFTSKMSNRWDLKKPKTSTRVCQKRLSKAKSVDEHLSCPKT